MVWQSVLYDSFLGRDWFEDELRAFQGGADGLMPCVWDDELSSFPQVKHYFIHLIHFSMSIPVAKPWYCEV